MKTLMVFEKINPKYITTTYVSKIS